MIEIKVLLVVTGARCYQQHNDTDQKNISGSSCKLLRINAFYFLLIAHDVYYSTLKKLGLVLYQFLDLILAIPDALARFNIGEKQRCYIVHNAFPVIGIRL